MTRHWSKASSSAQLRLPMSKSEKKKTWGLSIPAAGVSGLRIFFLSFFQGSNILYDERFQNIQQSDIMLQWTPTHPPPRFYPLQVAILAYYLSIHPSIHPWLNLGSGSSGWSRRRASSGMEQPPGGPSCNVICPITCLSWGPIPSPGVQLELLCPSSFSHRQH